MNKIISVLLVLVSFTALGQDKDPKALLQKAVAKVGGLEQLYQKKDVTFRYTYGNAAQGVVDVSLEKYIFDGEQSWASYQQSKATMKARRLDSGL